MRLQLRFRKTRHGSNSAPGRKMKIMIQCQWGCWNTKQKVWCKGIVWQTWGGMYEYWKRLFCFRTRPPVSPMSLKVYIVGCLRASHHPCFWPFKIWRLWDASIWLMVFTHEQASSGNPENEKCEEKIIVEVETPRNVKNQEIVAPGIVSCNRRRGSITVPCHNLCLGPFLPPLFTLELDYLVCANTNTDTSTNTNSDICPQYHLLVLIIPTSASQL